MPVDDCPAEVKLRQVAAFDDAGEASGTRQVDAGYAWLLIEGASGKGTRHWLSADDSPLGHLAPADEAEDAGPPVALLVKVDPRSGEIRYGHPDDPRHRSTVSRSGWDRMTAAGLVPAMKVVERTT